MRIAILFLTLTPLLPATTVHLNVAATVSGSIGAIPLNQAPIKLYLSIDDARITGSVGAQSTPRSGTARMQFLNNGIRTYPILNGLIQVSVSNGVLSFTQTGGSTITVNNSALGSTDLRSATPNSRPGSNAQPALTFSTSRGTLTINAGATFTFHNQDPSADSSGAGSDGGGVTTFTVTTKTIIETTQNTQNFDTFLTRITARLNGGSPVYDQSFNAPFTDPSVQAAVAQARAALPNATISGPTLASTNRTLANTSQQSIDGATTSESIVGNIIGPATMSFGDDGAQNFFVANGSNNIDVFTANITPRTITTTNTYLTSETYTLEGSTTPVTPPTGMRFVSLTPCRLLETRPEYNFQNRILPFGPPFLNKNETRTFVPQLSTVCAIPNSAKAYVLNVTVIPRGLPVDYVTVFPAGESRPDYWTVRSQEGLALANSAIVKAGAGGAISVFTPEATDMIIDIAGYFTDNPQESNLVYYPMTPCRVIETRQLYRPTPGQFGPPSLIAKGTRTFRFPQSTDCTIPTGAAAYSVTLTVVPPAPLPFVTAWPSNIAQPPVSSINSFNGRTLANSVILPAAPDGGINLYAFEATDMIVDINGYFAPDNGTTGLFYFPVTQCRLSNSTDNTLQAPYGPPIFDNETTRTINPTLSRCGQSLPAAPRAYVLNATVIPNGNPMPFLTVWPTGQPRPGASVINAFEGQTVSSGFIVPAGSNAAIDVFAFRRTHVALEISGYFSR